MKRSVSHQVIKVFSTKRDKDGNVNSPSLLNNLMDSEVAPRPLS